jgi:hypothetical protein
MIYDFEAERFGEPGICYKNLASFGKWLQSQETSQSKKTNGKKAEVGLIPLSLCIVLLIDCFFLIIR